MNRVLLFTTFSCFFIEARSQDISPTIVNSAGQSGNISGVTFEYTVGEPVVATVTKTDIELTQGFLQPTSPTTTVQEQINDDALEIFPNPFSDYIFLKPRVAKNTSITYALTDASGKVLATKKILLSNGKEQQLLKMADYAAGYYFLIVTLHNQAKVQSRTWKLIKSK